MISAGWTPRQRTVTGTLATIAADVTAAELPGPVVIVVGEVVGLRAQLGDLTGAPRVQIAQLGNHRHDDSHPPRTRVTGPAARAQRVRAGRAAEGSRDPGAGCLPGPSRPQPRGVGSQPPTGGRPGHDRGAPARQPRLPRPRRRPRSHPRDALRRARPRGGRGGPDRAAPAAAHAAAELVAASGLPVDDRTGIILAAAGSRDVRAVGAMESLFRVEGPRSGRTSGSGPCAPPTSTAADRWAGSAR